MPIDKPIVVHVTDVLAYKACRRRWYWGSRYRSAFEPAKPYGPFFIGQGVHSVIEQIRSDGADIPSALSAFLRHKLRPYRQSPEWRDIVPEIRGHVKMIRALVSTYLHYAKTSKSPFRDDMLETLAHEMKFGPEGEFPAVRLSIQGIPLEPTVYLAGTLDGLDRYKKDGTVWISEYKTCRDLDERAKLLQHDEQATAYCFAAQELFGEPVSGVIYTLMRKKIPERPKVLTNGTLSKSERIDTTVGTFRDVIYRHHGPGVTEQFIQATYGAVLRSIAEFGEPFITRVAITRSQDQIDNYIKELHATALEMHNPSTYLYANRTWSCPGCEFRQPCLARDRGENSRELLLLKTAYRQREASEADTVRIAQ